jgi:hypothetical protein
MYSISYSFSRTLFLSGRTLHDKDYYRCHYFDLSAYYNIKMESLKLFGNGECPKILSNASYLSALPGVVHPCQILLIIFKFSPFSMEIGRGPPN